MNTIESRKSTSLRLRRGLYEHLAERAKSENRSFNNFVEKILVEAMEHREPNEETKEAMDQAIRDMPYRNYKKFRNAKDLLKDLMDD